MKRFLFVVLLFAAWQWSPAQVVNPTGGGTSLITDIVGLSDSLHVLDSTIASKVSSLNSLLTGFGSFDTLRGLILYNIDSTMQVQLNGPHRINFHSDLVDSVLIVDRNGTVIPNALSIGGRGRPRIDSTSISHNLNDSTLNMFVGGIKYSASTKPGGVDTVSGPFASLTTTGLIKYYDFAKFTAKPDTTAGPFADATHTGFLKTSDWNSFHNKVSLPIDSLRSFAAEPVMKPPNTKGKYDDEFDGGWLDTVNTWHWLDRGRLPTAPAESTMTTSDPGAKAFLLNGNLYMQCAPPTTQDSLRCLYQTLNTAVDTCFSITVACTFSSIQTIFGHAGIFLMNSSNSKMIIFGFQANANAPTGWGIVGFKWTGPAQPSFTAVLYNFYALADIGQTRCYFRLQRQRPDLGPPNTGSLTYQLWFSTDGIMWRVVWAEALSTYIETSGKIDRIGVWIHSNAAAGSQVQALFPWFRYNWTPDWNPLANR